MLPYVTGEGSFRFANGDVYEGHWKGGQREGHGVYSGEGGNTYDGEYLADKMHGAPSLPTAHAPGSPLPAHASCPHGPSALQGTAACSSPT